MFDQINKYLVKACLLLCVSNSFPCHADLNTDKSIELVTLQFPPYIWCEEGKALGVDAEIIDALFKRVGKPYTLECLPWKRTLHQLAAGEVDGAFPAFKTPRREGFAKFLEYPLHYSEYKVVVLKGHEFDVSDIDSLKEKELGIDIGFSVSPVFDKARHNGHLSVNEAYSSEQNVKKLVSGRIDAYINNFSVVCFFAKRLDLGDNLVALPAQFLPRTPAYLILSKPAAQDKALVTALNLELADMWRSGEIEQINKDFENECLLAAP